MTRYKEPLSKTKTLILTLKTTSFRVFGSTLSHLSNIDIKYVSTTTQIVVTLADRVHRPRVTETLVRDVMPLGCQWQRRKVHGYLTRC